MTLLLMPFTCRVGGEGGALSITALFLFPRGIGRSILNPHLGLMADAPWVSPLPWDQRTTSHVLDHPSCFCLTSAAAGRLAGGVGPRWGLPAGWVPLWVKQWFRSPHFPEPSVRPSPSKKTKKNTEEADGVLPQRWMDCRWGNYSLTWLGV